MIDPADATLRAFCETLAEDPADEATLCACVDWLLENGATLREVLLLYLGTYPKFSDGLPRTALVKWLRTTEDEVWVNVNNAINSAHKQVRWYAILSGRYDKSQVLGMFPEVNWATDPDAPRLFTPPERYTARTFSTNIIRGKTYRRGQFVPGGGRQG